MDILVFKCKFKCPNFHVLAVLEPLNARIKEEDAFRYWDSDAVLIMEKSSNKCIDMQVALQTLFNASKS